MSALNSLSAQYTDSEGETDEANTSSGSRKRVSDGDVEGENHRQKSPPKSPSPPPFNEDSSSNIGISTGLVSYDGEIDDDDDDDDEEVKDVSGDDGEHGSVDMEISVSDEEMFSTATNGRSPDNAGRCHDNKQQSPVTIATTDTLIPPEPSGNCSRELQDTVVRLVENQRNTGADMNERFKNKKDFRNPSIYEKLITFCGIDEFGTNYPPELYDPGIWGKQSYYDELARVQKEDMERREKERKERTKIEVVSGTKKVHSTSDSTDINKRRSKWDVMAPSSSNIISSSSSNINVSLPPPTIATVNLSSFNKKK